MEDNINFSDKDKETTEEELDTELDEELDSENNSSNSENLTSSMLSLNNDLNSSTLSINEEENNLLNNYKYSNNEENNIEITIDNFIKLTQNYPELILMISNAQKNIILLPELMKNIKLYDHRLSLNLMDNPSYCFNKIFDYLFNKSDNIEDHQESINQILDIFPAYTSTEIFDILKSCNYNIDLTIEKLCY